jgi:hypothetical protein
MLLLLLLLCLQATAMWCCQTVPLAQDVYRFHPCWPRGQYITTWWA